MFTGDENSLSVNNFTRDAYIIMDDATYTYISFVRFLQPIPTDVENVSIGTQLLLLAEKTLYFT